MIKGNTEIANHAGDPDSADVARALFLPGAQGAMAMQPFADCPSDPPDLVQLNRELRARCLAVNAGDLSNLEGLLTAQAITLDAIFGSLARRAGNVINNQGNLEKAEAYLRLALRAQGQCRATVDTIASVKNPRSIAFVTQANITNGPQQINNGAAHTPGVARAEIIDTTPNKLSQENHDGQLLSDSRTSSGECCAVPAAPAVGNIDRAKVRRR